MHRIPSTWSQLQSHFGQTRDFHPTITSYEYEMRHNIIMKIVEFTEQFEFFFLSVSIKNSYVIIVMSALNNNFFCFLSQFKTTFDKPSELNYCKDKVRKCPCNNECNECSSKSIYSKLVYIHIILKNHEISADCRKSTMKAFDFTSLNFKEKFHHQETLNLSKT